VGPRIEASVELRYWDDEVDAKAVKPLGFYAGRESVRGTAAVAEGTLHKSSRAKYCGCEFPGSTDRPSVKISQAFSDSRWHAKKTCHHGT
jgi:hypothetical protein